MLVFSVFGAADSSSMPGIGLTYREPVNKLTALCATIGRHPPTLQLPALCQNLILKLSRAALASVRSHSQFRS
jgi:hypothetical protein